MNNMTCCPEHKVEKGKTGKHETDNPKSIIGKWLYKVGRQDLEKAKKASSSGCH